MILKTFTLTEHLSSKDHSEFYRDEQALSPNFPGVETETCAPLDSRLPRTYTDAKVLRAPEAVCQIQQVTSRAQDVQHLL